MSQCVKFQSPIKSEHYGQCLISEILINNKVTPIIKYIHDNSQYLRSNFNKSLARINWHPLYATMTVEDLFQIFNAFVSQCVLENAPLKKTYIRHDKIGTGVMGIASIKNIFMNTATDKER